MYSFNKKTILDFSKDFDNILHKKAYDLIFQDINNAMSEIKSHTPFINNYQVLIANEIFSSTEFYGSNIDLFLCLDAIQLQNFKKSNKFYDFFKNFSESFKNNFTLFKSKKKKQEKEAKKFEKKIDNIDVNDYDYLFFIKDFTNQLRKQLYEKTTIINTNKCIKIVGREEFGVNISIYPVFEYENIYKLFDINSKLAININFINRFKNFIKKDDDTFEAFSKQVKIFNNLFWNITKILPNQIFIESLLYSCPNNLFLNEIQDSTVNIINYLINSNIKDIVSICDEQTKLFKDKLCTTSYSQAIKFLNNIIIEKDANL